jgi:hypothetical protein
MVNQLGWATVPVVTLVSFTFMGIEGIAEQIEMPFGKHVCFCHMANTLTGSVQAFKILISRWVGLHTKLGTSLLNQCMVHRSLLLGFEGRDQVSNIFFSQSELLLTHKKLYHRKAPRGWYRRLWLGRRRRRRLILRRFLDSGTAIPYQHFYMSTTPHAKPT